MLTEKRSFAAGDYCFKNSGRTIPITFGYETYGKLNDNADNAVLVCQYFTGTSHAAGKYAETDLLPGWWDALIGPGKVIDTDKYYVICSDAISNINFNSPTVITTGPGSIDPTTGKPYGMNFPIFTLDDVVILQKRLIESLGIAKLRFVIGPSMGGLQAYLWAKLFPEAVEKIISVVATPMMRPSCIMVPNQLGIEAIMLDPKWQNGNYYGDDAPYKGLLLAFKMLLTATRTDHWSYSNFKRTFLDPTFITCANPYQSFSGRFLVEGEVEKSVITRMQFFDPNAYIYIAKANTLFDLCEPGETLKDALAKIKTPVRMIIDDSDLMFTREQSEEARPLFSDCDISYYNSRNGHLSCLFETDYLKEPLNRYISQ
ncbi:MAG: homoserine acetyltransferase [Candidatus Riflebacteria bacterium HGW-Riflebacteria-1]|jgi:homoserine O-acetyltransferase|nr:MAG: homoserine acetyltransferase [Candidatus Riflebacteria bacterium HGW-Riflebacteria-1]